MKVPWFNPHRFTTWNNIYIIDNFGEYQLKIDKDLQGLDRREIVMCFENQYHKIKEVKK